MNHYKLRAECQSDVDQFGDALETAGIKLVAFEWQKWSGFPDVELQSFVATLLRRSAPCRHESVAAFRVVVLDSMARVDMSPPTLREFISVMRRKHER